YAIIDQYRIREWAYVAVVFGANAIVVYWCSIMAKILLLNTPRVASDNYRALSLIKYATLIVVLAILGTLVWRMARWLVRYVGPAAYALLVPAAVAAAAMWTLFPRHPIEHVKQAGAAQPVIGVVLMSLEGSLGNWAGGWVFTFTFVAFWWLVV